MVGLGSDEVSVWGFDPEDVIPNGRKFEILACTRPSTTMEEREWSKLWSALTAIVITVKYESFYGRKLLEEKWSGPSKKKERPPLVA
jgi:hypothetical protein